MALSDVPRSNGRERRKRATRAALRAATLELGLRHGLDAVSVDAIAERAGVSPRTFFNYFDSKQDAALIDVLAIDEAQLGGFAAGPPERAWADLTALFVADVERAAADGLDLARYLQLHAGDPTLQAAQLARFTAFAHRLADAIADRLGADAVDVLQAPLMAGSCITAVRVALEQWARGDGEPIGPLAARAFALLDASFGSDTP